MKPAPSILLLVSVLIPAAAANAQTPDTAKAVMVDQPLLDVPVTNFDFGYAPQGSSISHTFRLKNVGGDTLRISDVRPACGCTKAPLKKTVLAAGDSTDVEVIFSTGNYSSTVLKSATIISNTTGASPPLTFSAYPSNTLDSLLPYRITPLLLDLDADRPAPGKDGWERSVVITNNSDHPCVLTIVSAPDRFFRVETPGAALMPGSTGTIRILLEPGAADTTFAKSFTVEFTGTSKIRYTLPVRKSTRWEPATPGQ